MSELPDDAVQEAERLTRLARNAVDEREAGTYERRRDELLAEHGFASRIRDEDDTLVLHPTEWVVDGVVRVDRIDDTDRAVEVSLSGPGEETEWAAVEEHNAKLVAAVASEHGPVHAANARAFADFMGNHYAKRAESATGDEIEEFLTEYFPRNAWPSEEQRTAVETTVELVFEAADAEVPGFSAES